MKKEIERIANTVRLPEPLQTKVEIDAAKNKRSFNAQIEWIIEQHYAKKKGK